MSSMIADCQANFKLILEIHIPKIIKFQMMISCMISVRKDLNKLFRKGSKNIKSNMTIQDLVKMKLKKSITIMIKILIKMGLLKIKK